MPQRIHSQIDTHNAHQAHFHSEKLSEHTTLLEAIKTNTSETTINAGDIELHVDGLEGLVTTTNTKLSGGLPSALTGSGNLKVCIQELGNEGSERLNVDVGDDITQLPTALTGEGNLKVSIQEDHTHNLATSANQTTTNGHLATLAGAVTGTEMQVDVLTMPTVAVTLSGGATEAKQDDAITHLATIAGDTTSIDGKITACNTGAVTISASALPSGASTASLQGGGLPSALSSDNLKVSLKETITVPVSNTTLTNLNNCIGSNELQVDIVASLPTGSNAIGKLSANSGVDIGDVDVTSLPLTFNSGNKDATCQRVVVATDDVNMSAIKSSLTTIEGTVGLSKVNVNLSSDAVGLATSSLQAGGLPSALSSDNLKVSLKETITVPVSNIKTTGEWLATSTAIADDAYSASLDCSTFREVRIFGKNASALGPASIDVMGSQTDSGTYYKIAELSRETIAIGGTNELHYLGQINMPTNFIKLYNNSGGSTTLELDYVGFSV